MFRIAAQMRSDRADIQGTNYIRNGTGSLEINENVVREVWRGYFEELLNVENESQVEEVPCVEGPVEEITLEEVGNALGKMKNRRAAGPSGVTSEMLKSAGLIGREELQVLYNKLLHECKCPDEWLQSLTVAVYKGKQDPLQCSQHRGLRLLEHAMKVFEKILEQRLRKVTSVMNGQFGFMPGKSCTDAIFILRRMQEKYMEKNKKLFHVFVDLEKAFDRVPRKVIEWALRRQEVPERLVRIIMCLYIGSTSRVCAAGGTSEAFTINVGVHQGSPLSPLLFALVLEEVTREARLGGVKEMLYADDLVLTGETREEVEAMFMEWKRVMESRGLKVNMGKTKLMISGAEESEPVQSGRFPCAVCGRGVGSNSILCTQCSKWCHQRCSGHSRQQINPLTAASFVCPSCVRGPTIGSEPPLSIDGSCVQLVDHFCYLGDMLSCEGGAERALVVRVAAAWRKWRDIASLLTNGHIPLRSRGSIYSACIRPVLLYGTETWSFTKRMEDRMQACDRRMLRYMAGVTLADRIPSEEVASRCGVEEVAALMRRGRLRWFGHVLRRNGAGLLGEVMELNVPGVRSRGRPRKQWKDNIKEDMKTLNLREESAYDRDVWREAIKPSNPTGRRRR